LYRRILDDYCAYSLKHWPKVKLGGWAMEQVHLVARQSLVELRKNRIAADKKKKVALRALGLTKPPPMSKKERKIKARMAVVDLLAPEQDPPPYPQFLGKHHVAMGQSVAIGYKSIASPDEKYRGLAEALDQKLPWSTMSVCIGACCVPETKTEASPAQAGAESALRPL
jgi:hypothetical protein